MKKIKYITFALLFLLSPMMASAQLYAIRDSIANNYNFWLYVPNGYKDNRAARAAARKNETDSLAKQVGKPLPIVLFLHGRSLSGTNLYLVRKYGTLDALTAGRKINAVVIAPQVKHGDWWRPNRLMEIIKWVSKRYDVDETRIYVLGMSLGGYGTIDFAATYPDKTAAAMAFCGGASSRKPEALKNLNKVPLWIMHGTADVDVPVSESRRVRDAMLQDDKNLPLLRYDEFEGAGHSIFARTFYTNEAYEWLFKHSTADSVRTVDRTVQIPITRLQRPNAYAGLKFHSVNLKVVDPLGVGTVPKTIPSNKPVAKYHTITSGDTLGHLAIKYKTTVRKLCELNKMKDTDILKLGKKLRVQ